MFINIWLLIRSTLQKNGGKFPMKKKNIILAVAAAMAMVAGTTAANALDIIEAGTAKNVSVTSTAAKLKALTSGAATTTFTIASTAAQTVFNVGDVITIKVNGAKFDRTALGATPVALTTPTVATWVLNAVNDTLTGTVTAASTTGTTSDVITLSGMYDLTGVASGTAVSLTGTVSGNVLGVNQVIHKILPPATDVVVLNTTPSLQKFGTIVATPATATVASSFIKLNVATNVTATAATVPVANLPATALDDYNAATAATGTLFVKLTGLPANATKVDWAVTGITQSDATGTAAPATATAAGNFWLDGAGNGYAKIAAVNSKASLAATAFVVTVNGTSAIAPSNVKMAVDYIAGASDAFVSHQALAPTNVVTITRNGSAFSVNAAGALNTVKITDMSGSLTATTGKISVTAYDAAGALAAGTAPVLTRLASNATVTIPMSTLTTAYPTAVRFDFVVESTEIVASNVKKSAVTGTSVTTYRNAQNGAGTVAGNGAL